MKPNPQRTRRTLRTLALSLPISGIILAGLFLDRLGLPAWGWPVFSAVAVLAWIARFGRALTAADQTACANREREQVENEIARIRLELGATLTSLRQPPTTMPFNRN
jgi:hypothetical protein